VARRKSQAKARRERPESDGRVGSHRGEWLVLAGILLVGLSLRAAYLGEIVRGPDFDSPGVDAGFHDYWARGLAFGDWPRRGGGSDPRIGSTPFLRPPGYPYFLALIYKLTGPGYLAPRVIQMALGLVNCALAFWLARRWFGRGVGLLLAGFMACYWIFIYYEGQLHEPVLLVFLLLSLAGGLGLWAEKLTLRYALAAGLLLGLAALTRPNALLFLPVALAWGGRVAYRRCPGRRLCAAGITFVVGAAAAIAPAALRNYLVARESVLISANAGINLLIGNHEKADGFFVGQILDLGQFRTCYDYPRLIENLEAQQGRAFTYSQASSYFAGQALGFMRHHPGRVLQLTLKKAWLFWGPREISHNQEVHYEREFSGVLGRVPGSFSGVAGLFVVGLLLWAGQRRRRKKSLPVGPSPVEGQARMAALVLLIVLVYFVSYLPFFNTALYRVPVIPFLLLFGAYGVVSIGRFAVAGEFRRTAAWVLLALVLYWLAGRSLLPYQPDLAKWYFNRGAAYSRKGEYEPAISEYNRAITIRPSFFEARVSLGWSLLERGRLAESIEQFQEALRLRPDSLEAHQRLAGAYMKSGSVVQAARHYSAALELDPADAVLRTKLGVAWLRLGQEDRAAGEFEQAVRLGTTDPLAHASLGTRSQKDGRLEEAIAHFTEAVRLDPRWAEARFRLAAALERVGRLDEAILQYGEVLRLDPQDLRARARLQALGQGESR